MKKRITTLLAVLLIMLLLCACGTEKETAKPAPDYAAQNTAGVRSEDTQNEEDTVSREPNLIFAGDLFEGYGFVHQMCDETGVYDFAPVNSDGIDWEVYILNKEFDDAERFIPQAYECALVNSGRLSIQQGQWIYIYCPCNQWTMLEAPEGCAFSWGINPDLAYGDATVPNAEMLH